MQVFLQDTHAYPGCRARLPEDLPVIGTDVVVCFTAGIEAPGHLSPSADGYRLEVAGYRTAADRSVSRKLWWLRQDDSG